MKQITTLAIDLAKTVFQLHGVDERGVAVLRKQVRRTQLLQLIAQLALDARSLRATPCPRGVAHAHPLY